jgi:hypothetical protein
MYWSFVKKWVLLQWWRQKNTTVEKLNIVERVKNGDYQPTQMGWDIKRFWWVALEMEGSPRVKPL